MRDDSGCYLRRPSTLFCLARTQGAPMIVQRVFVAAQPSESRGYLLDELRRLGCEIVGPFSSSIDALQQLPNSRVQMGILSFCLADGTSSEIERRLRSAGTPIL